MSRYLLAVLTDDSISYLYYLHTIVEAQLKLLSKNDIIVNNNIQLSCRLEIVQY